MAVVDFLVRAAARLMHRSGRILHDAALELEQWDYRRRAIELKGSSAAEGEILGVDWLNSREALDLVAKPETARAASVSAPPALAGSAEDRVRRARGES